MTKLEKLADKFITELNKQTKNAKNEETLTELENLAIDVICRIPIILVQKDYYGRSDIKSYLSESERGNTKVVNKIMEHLYNQDIISFCYDQTNQAIEDELNDIIIIKGANDGI